MEKSLANIPLLYKFTSTIDYQIKKWLFLNFSTWSFKGPECLHERALVEWVKPVIIFSDWRNAIAPNIFLLQYQILCQCMQLRTQFMYFVLEKDLWSSFFVVVIVCLSWEYRLVQNEEYNHTANILVFVPMLSPMSTSSSSSYLSSCPCTASPTLPTEVVEVRVMEL